MHRGRRKVKNETRNYENHIHQFQYKGNLLTESLKVDHQTVWFCGTV